MGEVVNMDSSRPASRLASTRLRASRRDDGLCTQCGGTPVSGKRLCKKDAEYQRLKAREYWKRKIALKKCVNCGQDLPRSRKKYICQACMAKWTNRRRARKARAVKFLGGACKDCGLVSDFMDIYDFDHVVPGKTRNVSYLITDRGWSVVEKELALCELVCANCHRIRSAKRGGWA